MELIAASAVAMIVVVFSAWLVRTAIRQSEQYREDCFNLASFRRRAVAIDDPNRYAELAAADEGAAIAAAPPSKEVVPVPSHLPIPESALAAAELARTEAENRIPSPTYLG